MGIKTTISRLTRVITSYESSLCHVVGMDGWMDGVMTMGSLNSNIFIIIHILIVVTNDTSLLQTYVPKLVNYWEWWSNVCINMIECDV